jgi:hypothetical protein
LENMNQDKAIFMSQCSALPHKNDEILVYILPFKSTFYLIPIPYVTYVVKILEKHLILLYKITSVFRLFFVLSRDLVFAKNG